MSLSKTGKILFKELGELKERGSLKGKERVMTGIREGDKGTRYFLEGCRDKEFPRINSNSYLRVTSRKEVIETEERVGRTFGVGRGAVRLTTRSTI